MVEATTGLKELMEFLVEQSQRKTFGRVEFNLNAGQIGIVKFEQHFRPSELKDRKNAPGNAGAKT
jgi:hypothetical protein